MSSMALSHPDDAAPIGRQRSLKHRQFSLYASRIKPIDTSAPLPPNPASPPQIHDRAPQIPPLPVSPRWDSLSHAHLLIHSPAEGSLPKGVDSPPDQRPVPPMHNSPHSTTAHDEFPPIPFDTFSDPPSRPLTAKSSNADMRHSQSSGVENFSRPRKASIKQPALEDAKPRSADALHTDLLQDIPTAPPQTPPWQRPRGPSVSSAASSIYPSAVPQANAHPEVPTPGSGSPRLRTAPIGPPPTYTPTRPAISSYSRVDSSASAPAGSFSPNPPWMGGDELRSSFRSQFTTSTAPGTALTERSSVMTKDSSVSSLDPNNDEPSLEDVMGMYEKGFADDSDDENENTDSDDNYLSRPVTGVSEAASTSAPTLKPVEEIPPPLPISRTATNLDAEIRQSKMLFTSPEFTAMLPAVAGDAVSSIKEEEQAEKRDSGKSMVSERSEVSAPTSNGAQAATFAVSPVVSSPSPSPSPSPATRYEEFEEPGSRDRYGFKKSSQGITREQYDEWNKGYSQYLARRRRKWIAYLKDSALMTDRPIRFPAPNAKTKRFVRKGIPPDWRGAAWFYYAGGPAILSKHSGLYEKLLQKQAKQIDIEAIERDLHRTFPDNIQFKPSPGGYDTASSSERESQATLTGSSDSAESGPRSSAGEPPIITSLRRVLHAFSVYNPRIGYCQSLNFLAGLLLLFVETEEQCFWLLNVITHIYLPGTHEMSLEGSKVDLGVLMAEIRDTMPEVWDRIGGELEEQTGFKPAPSRSIRIPRVKSRHRGQPSLSTERLPPITLCMTAWFMSCYIGTLPIETTLRVWDVFFYEGSKTLFRVAMAIFKQGESEIKAISDPMEMFGVVQSLPRKMLDANQLMDQCFKRRNGFGHLNQDTIDDRRRERREKGRIERGQLSHSQTLTGDVPKKEPEVQRRATLFGKKKRDASRPRAAEA
ncbi:hypothetical protein K4F52_003985 [Lecanicillium sp. MT-2017a]|nr:hypothetical protein K4F52_003985 [Lecanicillium sp. MT-2017a]